MFYHSIIIGGSIARKWFDASGIKEERWMEMILPSSNVKIISIVISILRSSIIIRPRPRV